MNVAPVLEFLRQKIGLNPASIGTEIIARAVHEHMKLCETSSIDGYIRKLNESPEQQQILIESVVIAETSFFRNKIPFVTMRNYLERFVLHESRDHPIRILCLPCSTGEEPYSIAMVLLDMKLSAQQFHIDAGDISEQALQIARAGMYSAYSFRGQDVSYRDKYFVKKNDGYQLNQEVCAAVQFEQANILADNFLAGHQPYDIIFCRNLLIYFDDATKAKAINALTAHLAEDGVLFVGHAEGAKIPQSVYVSLDYPMSFAFARKKHAAAVNDVLNNRMPPQDVVAAPPPPLPPVNKPKPVIQAVNAKPVPAERKVKEQKTVAEMEQPGGRGMAEAKTLLDKGAFGEAAAICEKMLENGAESAEIYYLLGQASAETGNNLMAEEYLKKAIYLDSDFHDALMYLSVIYDRMGNHEKSVAFRKRAERVHQRIAGK